MRNAGCAGVMGMNSPVALCPAVWLRSPLLCGQRVGRMPTGLGSLPPWRCSTGAALVHVFFWLLVVEHPITLLLPIESGWIAHGMASKAAEPCKLLLAMWE